MNPQSGWQAELKLGFERSAGKTLLAERKRCGPLAVQRAFYPEGDVCHVYILHPPGGVVGGDRLTIEVKVGQDAHALLTTPGATKFYRSGGGEAVQTQTLEVADGAVLEWLPQENIFFAGARVRSRLELHLQGSAKAAAWEIHCLGRPVIEEVFSEGSLDSHWLIYRDGRPVLIERLRVDPKTRTRLSQLQAQAVTGTFIVTGVRPAGLEQLRERQITRPSEYLAMTLLDDLLVVRYLGDSTANARHNFSTIWSWVRESTLGKRAMVPRIWKT